MFWSSLLHRNGTMPKQVEAIILKEFRIDQAQLARLRSATKGGHYAGRSVRFVQVYDPTLLNSGQQNARKFDDLSQQRNAILFKGHIDGDGKVYLTDVRQTTSPTAKVRPKTDRQ